MQNKLIELWQLTAQAVRKFRYSVLSGIPLSWKVVSLLLLATSGMLVVLAPVFTRQSFQPEMILLVSGSMLLAGGVFLYMVELLIHSFPDKRLLRWILVVGALMRLLMLATTPILEVDFYRYFWDGAVLANGYNPYQYAPADIRNALADEDGNIPPELLRLAREPQSNIDRINHPHLRTIYPPLSQAAFAFAYLIKPWSMAAWRGVICLFDILTLLILLYILQQLKRSPLRIALYWLNPLLVKEIYNSGHMDLLVFPFLFAAIWLAIGRRMFFSATALALAGAVKIWPIALAPILLRPADGNYRRSLLAGGWMGIVLGVIFVPVWVTGLNQNSGFTAYSEKWQLNDLLFSIILRGSEYGLMLFNIHPGHGQMLTRAIVAFSIIAWIFYLAFRKEREVQDIFEQCLLSVAAVFLLSPTPFPWYYTWLIPFLVIRARRSFLLFTLLLPLYYLWYYYSSLNQVEVFDHWIVWIEFLPVWILLLFEWYTGCQYFILLSENQEVTCEKRNIFP